TLWYHDHRMGFTGPMLWRGLAGFFILRDDEERALPLPSADREWPLMICDRSFEADGSWRYPWLDPSLQSSPGTEAPYMGGVLGDVILVNGAPWPRADVSTAKYRLRLLNASNARHYELALAPAPPGAPHFVQIGSDGGLLAAPQTLRTIPIAPAQRFDVIVDFSNCDVGSQVVLVNLAGEGSTRVVMRFDVTRKERDDTHVPEQLTRIDVPDARDAVTRTFDFSYHRQSHTWAVNGQPYDPSRMDARPALGATEIWRLRSDFSHPLHMHLVHFQVLGHSGRPRAVDAGWKDTIALTAGETANILVPFLGYRGRYVFHCHNLEHEDMAMMANFEVV
ncbi:MAG: multicopper oxidase family protein, partial [Acidobacteriota bacterium]